MLESLYLIEGTLTTDEPLHIGSGQDLPEDGERGGKPSEVNVAAVAKKEVKVAAVARNAAKAAIIPGTSLKGVLCSYLRNLGATGLDQVFGAMEAGGPVAFLDAPSLEAAQLSPGREWNPQSRTCQCASTAIDRVTGAVDLHKLFQLEFVPPGVQFKLRLFGRSVDQDGHRRADHLATLGPALAALSAGQIRFGAGAPGQWGRCTASHWTVRVLAPPAIAAWARDGKVETTIEAALAASAPQPLTLPAAAPAAQPVFTLKVTLAFEGAFLVNDPAATGDVSADLPSLAAVRNHKGEILLPSSSFRGAFRSQAERIFRTIGGVTEDLEIKSGAELALISRAPIAQVFGAPGWRSPLEISDFTQVNAYQKLFQDFVAIDRFTGGGAEEKKFCALAVWKPVLEGRLHLHPDRLADAGGGKACLGLLALALRDLAEGDICFGWGASRGYGRCLASIAIESPPPWNELPGSWRKAIPEPLWNSLASTAGLDEAAMPAIESWIGDLHQLVEENTHA